MYNAKDYLRLDELLVYLIHVLKEGHFQMVHAFCAENEIQPQFLVRSDAERNAQMVHGVVDDLQGASTLWARLAWQLRRALVIPIAEYLKAVDSGQWR